MKVKTLFASLCAFLFFLSACSSQADPSEELGDGDEAGEKMTLSWFIPVDQATTVLPESDFVRETVEEKFNVALDITYMPFGEDRDNQLNVQIASGETPDMFVPTGTASQTYALDGILADMTPFVSPETMPHYFNWIDETELERYAIENGFVRAPVPFARNVYRSYYIRKDWLDNLGLEMPSSYEEMMDVMRAFTFDDPDGNGKNDTYGMSAAGNGTSISWDLPQWIHNDLIGAFMVEDESFIDVQSDPRVEGVINDAVDMIEEGIIDPDWFLNEGTEHVDRAAQGKVGIVLGAIEDFAFDANPNSLINKTKAINPEAEWVPFNPFPDKPGVWTENLPDTPFVFPASLAEESPEKIERTVEILDWLASEEGFLLSHYGIEGTHYTREGNTITLNPEAIQQDIVEQGNFLDVYDFFTPNEPEVLGLEVIDPRMTDRDRQIEETVKSYPKIPSIGTNVAPPEGYNLADFRAKMSEYHLQMLFDEKSGDNWPKYREELMTEYDGKAVFQAYVEQIRAAGIEVKDFE